MEPTETRGHAVSYRTYIQVWLLLLFLTALLVLTSTLYHESLSVWAMLILTPIKAGLVFFYFMHLKYEKTSLKALVFMTLGLLIMVIGILFLDLSFR